jgi:4-carboxymuconolactone decarboxylase
MYPEDVDPESGCRLPLPRREQLDDAGQRTYDGLADPQGRTIRGLRSPGGILLHSPELSRHARPLNCDTRRDLEDAFANWPS